MRFAAVFGLCTMLVSMALAQQENTKKLELLMPDVAPTFKDAYLCAKFRVDEDNLYLTAFQPNSTKEIAHHILLFGCAEPGGEDVWNCGEMARSQSGEKQYEHGPVCKGSKQSIVYAWAMDAPKLVLPKGSFTSSPSLFFV